MQTDDKKEILESIDTVARTVAHIVENMATKEDLEKLEAKIDGVEERLSGKITNLQNRVDVYAGLDRRVESMDKRLTKVEVEVAAI